MYRNKLAYSGHRELPTCPDALASGLPALRVSESDPNTFACNFISVFSVSSSDPERSRGERARATTIPY